jgi:plastocyanin
MKGQDVTMASRMSRVGSHLMGNKLRRYGAGRWLSFGILLTLSVLLAACASGSRRPQREADLPPGDGTVVNVVAKISGFTLDQTSVNAGAVTFVVKNDDFMPHDFAIEGNGVQEKTARIAPRKTASLTVNLPAGTYTYVCTVDGHGQSMHGTFTAK